MSNKFTEGPWRYHNNRIESQAAWLVEPDEYGVGQRLIVVDLHGAMGGSDVNADARLIAAAPTMYEVLTAIIRDLPTNRDWLDPDIENMARALLVEVQGGNCYE